MQLSWSLIILIQVITRTPRIAIPLDRRKSWTEFCVEAHSQDQRNSQPHSFEIRLILIDLITGLGSAVLNRWIDLIYNIECHSLIAIFLDYGIGV